MECISKGKEHKKYDFGNKSAIAKTYSGLIVSALAFRGNPYDGHTLSAHWEQMRRLSGTAGDAINTLMAAAAYNLRHWMNKLPKKKLSSFVSLLLNLRNRLENLIFGCGKTYGLPFPVLATIEN